MRSWLALVVCALGTPAFSGELDWTTSLRAEGQLRNDPTSTSAAPVGSLEVLPLLGLDYHPTLQTRLALSYAPRFLLEGPSSATETELLHRGQLLFETRSEHGVRFSANEQASYGTLDFITAATSQLIQSGGTTGPSTPSAPLEALPPSSSVPFEETASELSLYLPLDRETSLSLDVSYLYSGGRGTVAQATLPLQQRPQFTAYLAHDVSREDQLLTSLLANYATFEGSVQPAGQEALDPFRAALYPLTFQSVAIVEATEAWHHRLSSLSDFTLSGGPSYVRQVNNAYGVPGNQVVPVLLGTVRRTVPTQGHEQVDAELSLGLSPYIDRLLGTGYERLEGAAQATWQRPPKWLIRGRLRGAVAVLAGAEHGTSILAGEVATDYVLRKDLLFEVGARVDFQREPLLSPLGYFDYVGFVSFTWAERGSL